MKSRLVSSSLSLAVALFAMPLGGGAASTSSSVSATVLASACSASVSPWYLRRAGGPAASSAVSVQCAHPTAYDIGIIASESSGVVVKSRKLVAPGLSLVEYAFAGNTRVVTDEIAAKFAGGVAGLDTHPVRDQLRGVHAVNWNEARSGTIMVRVDY